MTREVRECETCKHRKQTYREDIGEYVTHCNKWDCEYEKKEDEEDDRTT